MSNDYVTNPNTLSGNAVNYPTKLASTVIWAHSFASLIHQIRSVRNALIVVVTTSIKTTSTTAFDVAETTY